MNDNRQFENPPDSRDAYVQLGRWLQHILVEPEEEKAGLSSPKDERNNQFGLPFEKNSHPHFYQQLPDFILALLNNDSQATVHYAPLLYHLTGCTMCRDAYRELYAAMQFALQANEVLPAANKNTRPLSTMPSGMLVLLSQLFISQAEEVLREARREHTGGDAAARSLLQQAMQVSAHMPLSDMRQRALKDLVRVATLYDGPASSGAAGPAALAYAPSPVGAGGAQRGTKVRRGEGAIHPEQVIYLQASHLEGIISQDENILELQLHNLEKRLRGHYLIISVPLGSLIEPVHWQGGNPRAIRSIAPVDEQGTLKTVLGQTDMRLSNPEEHDLLEVMFLLLEVRPADSGV